MGGLSLDVKERLSLYPGALRADDHWRAARVRF
jgi:hypothetical protein